jgi:hypothetical protein
MKKALRLLAIIGVVAASIPTIAQLAGVGHDSQRSTIPRLAAADGYTVLSRLEHLDEGIANR